MDTATTELIEANHKRDPRGRKYTDASEREQLLAAFEKSGMTQRAFAQREGIKYSTFVSWIQGRRRSSACNSAKPSETLRFVEAGLPGLLAGVEVSLPDGTKVRGSDAREVTAVVLALRG